MNPFFSIIIPTYNRAQLLPIAIESVINQTYTNWELVIVDDGSKDNTKAVVDSYNDERITYIWQENKERSAARNNGIVHSTGTYICFLDSDDYFLKERLEIFHMEISSRNFPKALFYTSICFETDGEIRRREEEPNSFKSMMEYVVYNVIGNPQVCVHRTILEQHPFNETITISEDTELWVRILNAKYEFIYLNYCNVIASNHLERSIGVLFGNASKKMLDVLRFIFTKPHPGSIISKSTQNLAISINYFGQAKYFLQINKKYHALWYLLKSVCIDINNRQTKHKLFLLYTLVFMKRSHCNKLLSLIE